MKKKFLDLTVRELWGICASTLNCETCILKDCFCDSISNGSDVYSLFRGLLNEEKIIEYKNAKIKVIKNKTVEDRLDAIE